MEITINLIELSSDLAEEMVKIKFNYKENDIYIYIEEDEEITYTEQAQEVFNEWYDYYYDFLIEREIK